MSDPRVDDPAWGPSVDPGAAGPGLPLRNGAVDGYATRDGVFLSAGRIDALARCELGMARTSLASSTHVGLAQVRRLASGGPLRLLHVVFAPSEARPLLLGLARLRNDSAEPLIVDYTEIWEVDGADFAAGTGACLRVTAEGPRALADAGIAVRARVPEPPPRRGLALDVRLALPPHALRELHFAYAAPGPDGRPELLVRAWRGEVATALARTARYWLERTGATGAAAVEAYRAAVG